METYKMMQSMDRFRNPQDDLPVVGEEEWLISNATEDASNIGLLSAN
jgi:hypothetical protein